MSIRRESQSNPQLRLHLPRLHNYCYYHKSAGTRRTVCECREYQVTNHSKQRLFEYGVVHSVRQSGCTWECHELCHDVDNDDDTGRWVYSFQVKKGARDMNCLVFKINGVHIIVQFCVDWLTLYSAWEIDVLHIDMWRFSLIPSIYLC